MTKLIHAVLFSWATLAVARDAKQQPATLPILNQMTSQGCFSKLPASAEPVKAKAPYISSGFCNDACLDAKKTVAITTHDGCYCADTYPPESALVKDTQCNYPCSAYPMEACGGKDPEAYSVYNTGLELVVDNDDGKTAATTTISSITPPSTPLSSKLPSTSTDGTTTDATTTDATTTDATTAEDTTAVSTPTKGVAAEGTSADSTNGAQSTPSATGTDVPSAAAPRLSSPVGKFVRMFKVFFN